MSGKQERKRAPGGGRRKRVSDDDRLEFFPSRMSKIMREKLKQLADRRGTEMSTELRNAVSSHLRRGALRIDGKMRSAHTEAFARAVAVLADRIEEVTGKRWIDDPLTAQLVRERVGMLVAHIILAPPQPIAAPAEITEAADLVLTLLKAAVWRPGSPRLAGMVVIDDADLATAVSDLARDIAGAPSRADFPNIVALDPLVARRDQEMRDRKRRK